MSFSVVLDVAIGLALVYLLLSLVCSALSEMIELCRKRRAGELEAGIRELLGDEKAKEFYEHPLVFGLFQGNYVAGQWRNLPSYIPARTFALALMDLLQKGDSTTPSGAAFATAAPAPNSALDVSPAAPDIADVLQPLRDKVATLPDGSKRLKQALLPLIDAAGSDIAKVRENIEGWFDSAMDRASGRYKRGTQTMVFWIGVGLTLFMNVNTLGLAKHLMNDKTAREMLVAKAPEILERSKARLPNSPEGGKPNPAPSADANTSLTPISVRPVSTAQPAAGEIPNPAGTATTSGGADANQAEKELKEAIKDLTDLDLPLGWTGDWTAWKKLKTFDQKFLYFFFFMLPGWVITALAISFGAPFWFDVLNKFMIVRSTVKPKEKSPEEPPIG